MKSLRRIIFPLLLALLCPQLLQAQMRWNSAYQNYIDQYKDLAIEQMMRWHIPASITLAQGLLESRAGLSDLTRRSNNHFGIKCHGWAGASVYSDDDERNECFRAYANARDSYDDHSRFLAGGQRYRRLFSLSPTDYKGWARGLKAAGYATSPTYASKLIEIIELYKLYKFDSAKSYDHFMSRHAGTDQPAVSGESMHRIYLFNDNYYVIARQGDTFKSIAKEVGISYRKIAKYNERNKRDRLEPGERIYLKKKRTRAERKYKKHSHTVVAGESMYSIAQKYGIRLKSLYKLNHMKPNDEITVGDGLKLR